MIDLDLTQIGKDPRWKVAGREASVVDVKGKRALKLSEGTGMGVVWMEGYDFADGVIELDMLGRSQPVQGSFLGVAFRGQRDGRPSAAQCAVRGPLA